MSVRQQIRSTPQINLNYWSFAITGSVRQPLILSFADLQQFPFETVRSAVTCTGSHAGRPMMREAVWRGVRLSAMLERIAPDAPAAYAHVFASDSYSTVMPLDALAGTLLAFEVDGATLTPADGFPARLIAPGLYGYKMPKWVSRIELRETAEGGFWEARGWALDGTAGTRVAITSHHQADDGSIAFAGVAFGGGDAIASVGISIDGAGEMPIPFTPTGRLSLTAWEARWMPPGAGDYAARVRAYTHAQQAEHTILVQVR